MAGAHVAFERSRNSDTHRRRRVAIYTLAPHTDCLCYPQVRLQWPDECHSLAESSSRKVLPWLHGTTCQHQAWRAPRVQQIEAAPGNSMQQSICALRGFEQSFGTEESFWQVRRLTEPKKVRPVAANWTATASPGFAPNRLIPCNGSLHRPVPCQRRIR